MEFAALKKRHLKKMLSCSSVKFAIDLVQAKAA